MQNLIEQINTFLQNNQILSTVAGGSVIVWLVSNIRSIFGGIVAGVTALVSFRIVNSYEDARNTNGYLTPSQKFFNRFLSSSKTLWERTQHLDLSTCDTLHHDEDEKRVTGRANVDSLAYGFSIRIIFGKIVFVRRRIDNAQKITVTTVLRVFFASKEKFMRKMQEAIEAFLLSEIEEDTTRDYICVYNGETPHGRKCKRAMDSIFTNHNEHYELLSSIESFIKNEEKYRRLSYPYTYSALLYGEPGCGKSSSILAVASALNKDISYINLGKITLQELITRLNTCHSNIIVFEDIDALTTAVGDKREEGEEKGKEDPSRSIRSLCSSLLGVSLSDLLNITDGLLASDGTICLFTTNHIERLDPAFLRSGRMNKLVEFTKLNRDTAAKMVKANLGHDLPPSSFRAKEINPADLQAEILEIFLGHKTWDNFREKFLI